MNHRNDPVDTVAQVLADLLNGEAAPSASSSEFAELSNALDFYTSPSTAPVELEKLALRCLQLLAARVEGTFHAQLALDQMRAAGRSPC